MKYEKIDRAGYWALFKPDHPQAMKQGYVLEHRLVMEKHLGRYLRQGEIVHHVNHNKKDNRIENLELCTSRGQHTKQHHPEAYERARIASLGRRPPNYNRGKKKCPTCLCLFEVTLGSSGKKFCSTKCYAKSMQGKQPKNTSGLLLGRGWNKGQPLTWALRGKESPSYKHGRYSAYPTVDVPLEKVNDLV